MEHTNIDQKILSRVQRKERKLLRSISIISLGIAALYVYGYFWRCAYYHTLGIPSILIEFPFPEILIPKNHLLFFIVQAILSFLYFMYRDFYIEQKRLERSKIMCITQPIENIYEYSMKDNIKLLPDEKITNHHVFCRYLGEYINDKYKINPDWEFNRLEFERTALKLFPDLPDDLKEPFITYELKVVTMEKDEIESTITDIIGLPPKGSKWFDKIQSWLLYIWLLFISVGILVSTTDVVITVIYVLSGGVVGGILYKMSKVVDRYQLWHTVWIMIVLIVVLNIIDGYITARSDLKHYRFPMFKITQTDGTVQSGLLFSSFSDGYIICPFEKEDDDYSKRIVVHNNEISFITLSTFKGLENSTQRKIYKLDGIKEEAEELEIKYQALKKVIGDPNTSKLIRPLHVPEKK